MFGSALANSKAPASPGAARYAFVAGQELTYRTTWSFKYWKGDKSSTQDQRTDVTIWVLRANRDGSYRLVVRQRDAVIWIRSGVKQENAPSTEILYADVFPDGRELPHGSSEFRVIPAILFPPLPRDAAQGKAGWEAQGQDMGFVCKRADGASGLVFDAAVQTPFDALLLDSHQARYTFDAGRGLIASSVDTWARDSSIKGAGNGKTQLLAAKAMKPDALKEMLGDADPYFTAIERYDARAQAASRAAPDTAERLLRDAAAHLKSATAGLRQPDMKAAAEARLKEHEARASYVIRELAERARRIGKAAPLFETTDIDGNKVRLADLRGKVVVLDFWYRGCGPCARSMPQMNQLAADFAGRPVAILGMNIDRDPADARFVAQKMQLKYPTLKAQDLTGKYGVEGFPTLIIIDQQGAIRDIHLGYNPTLRQDVGKAVGALLERK